MQMPWTLLLCALLPVLAWADVYKAEGDVLKNLFGEVTSKDLRPQGQKNPRIYLFDGPLNVTGEPVVVNVNMYVLDIGDIDDEDQEFKITMYLRQSWNDPRLKFTPADSRVDSIQLPDTSRIWVPDIFFVNGKKGDHHDITTENTFVRIKRNGDVLYSSRLTMTLNCPMDLSFFPRDKQTCPLRLESYGYPSKDMVLVWKEDGDPIQIAKGLNLGPFKLKGYGVDYCNSKTSSGEYSCLHGEFLFKRQLSTYLMQAYLPLGLLVVVSWIIFWLDERSFAPRVIVSVLILIATVFEASCVSASAPNSGESKAIDCWTSWTLLFVFFALVEQLVVILVTQREMTSDKESGALALTEENREEGVKQVDKTSDAVKVNLIKAWISKYDSCGRRVDVVSRLIFPLAFLLFNLTYWASYSDYQGLRALTVIRKMAYK